MPTTLGSVLFKDHRPERDCFVAAKMRAGRRDLHRQRHARRARRRRHAWLALRLDAQSLRSRTHRRRLVRRPGDLRLGEFRDGCGGAGGTCLDPPPGDLDGDHRHAAEHRPRQPRRRLWRLADNQRLARPDGAHGHRSRQGAGCNGRLRSRGSGHRARHRPRAQELCRAARQGRAARRAHRHSARADGPQQRSECRGFHPHDEALRSGDRRAQGLRRGRSSIRSSSPISSRCSRSALSARRRARRRSSSISPAAPIRPSARAKRRWPRRSSINCCRRPRSAGRACSRPVPP